MEHKGQILGQSRPADTNAVSIYSPEGNEATNIREIVIVNTTSSSHDFRIFLDDNGTTYDESTALYWDEALAADTTRRLTELDWWMRDDTGNLAVRSDTNSAFTFTVFGAIKSDT